MSKKDFYPYNSVKQRDRMTPKYPKKLCFGGYEFPVFSELTDTHLFHGKQINLSKTTLIHERIRNNL